MKKILIPVSNSFFVRNFLRSGFIQKIRDLGAEVVFLSPADKIPFYISEFGTDVVKFEPLPRITQLRLDNFFKRLEGWSIHSRFVYLAHRHFLARVGSRDAFLRRILLFPIRMTLWRLGSFALWRACVRKSYSLISNRTWRKILRQYNPSLVFCPSINLGQEWQIIREAKRCGIRTVGMTASWDNFYSKTFLRVFPDYLLVQTKLMRDQAVRLADYPASKISVVGLPQYDRYFKKNGIIPRNQFIVGLGGDPGKKLLVFACSGKVTLTEDVEMIELLRRLIKNGTLPAMNVLVRPHPKRTFSESYMEKIRKEYGFLALTPARKLNVAGDPWEFDERAISLLTNSLAHADVVISTCTTLFIEAAIFDAPLIAIGFDAGRKLNYWNSSRRFFEWEHMADLKRTGGVFNVTSERELVEALRLYLNDRKLHHEGREKIVAEQAVFTDGQSVSKTVDVLRSVF